MLSKSQIFLILAGIVNLIIYTYYFSVFSTFRYLQHIDFFYKGFILQAVLVGIGYFFYLKEYKFSFLYLLRAIIMITGAAWLGFTVALTIDANPYHFYHLYNYLEYHYN